MRAHGTRAKYVVEKCRCQECRRANSDYQTAREKRKAYEAWGDIAPALVPADEARDHLRFLQSAGIGLRRVALLTGLSRSELSRIRKGERQRVLYSTADLILGICQDDRARGRWGCAT